MYITMQNLITASAVLAAALALLGSYNRAYNWYRKQEKQDEDIGDLKEEQDLTYLFITHDLCWPASRG